MAICHANWQPAAASIIVLPLTFNAYISYCTLINGSRTTNIYLIKEYLLLSCDGDGGGDSAALSGGRLQLEPLEPRLLKLLSSLVRKLPIIASHQEQLAADSSPSTWESRRENPSRATRAGLQRPLGSLRLPLVLLRG